MALKSYYQVDLKFDKPILHFEIFLHSYRVLIATKLYLNAKKCWCGQKIFQFQRERERGTTLLINQIVLIFQLKFLLSASHEALTCKILSWTTLATLSWHHLSYWKCRRSRGNEDQIKWNCINISQKQSNSKVQKETL